MQLTSRILIIEIGVIFCVRTSFPRQVEQVLINLSNVKFQPVGSKIYRFLYAGVYCIVFFNTLTACMGLLVY